MVGAIYQWVKVYSVDRRVTAGERQWDDKQRTMYITGRLYIVSITVNTPPSLPIPGSLLVHPPSTFRH